MYDKSLDYDIIAQEIALGVGAGNDPESNDKYKRPITPNSELFDPEKPLFDVHIDFETGICEIIPVDSDS